MNHEQFLQTLSPEVRARMTELEVTIVVTGKALLDVPDAQGNVECLSLRLTEVETKPAPNSEAARAAVWWLLSEAAVVVQSEMPTSSAKTQ